MSCRAISALSALAFIAAGCVTTDKEGVAMRPNLPMPTLGGKQYWTDVYVYGGWRIQQNVFTKHHRLLGPKDVRKAWGTREQCQHALELAKDRGRAVLLSDKVCILLHAFLRSKDSFKGLKKGLEAEGYEVYSVNYASSRYDLDTLAAQMRPLLERVQEDFEDVYIVTHSMGGIIARKILSQQEYPKVRRLVMIAPPNQGAVMADKLLDWWPSQYVTGPAGRQLTADEDSGARNAGIPMCEFGVIAGARGTERGWNRMIPGDDDGLVSVASTRLDGMADFVVVRAWHATIMNKPKTIHQVIVFLNSGRFDHEAEGVLALPDN
ncbi:MAG TPA: alpha/beta fold hydrolase [Candidatus Hydrogenedentes bacterium]|nr:alpha/beta fold hydrolase [Candidatus Hydrogenedentota bacterium]